jgi:hypothetical protein
MNSPTSMVQVINYLKAINKALMNVARRIIVKGIISHCPLCSKIIVLL